MTKPLSLLFALMFSGTCSATTLNGFETSFYGFFKLSTLYATDALASYNNINLTAPTHAAAQTRPQDENSRMSFQAQQSRLGVLLSKENVLGRFEFDFVDFNKSSPTVQMSPRVRIASITYKLDDLQIIVGQDWDLFSPVTTYTFDYVGLYFLAGNTGFIRQQIQLIRTLGKWEIGGALGMAGSNPGMTDSDLEFGNSPSYAGRISYLVKNGRLGLSGIYSNLEFQSNSTRHEAYGVNLFFERIFNRTGVKTEAYYAQNMANIGSLGLGRGSDSRNVREFGGTLTFQQKVDEANYLFGGVGFAKVDNPTELTPFSLNPNSTIDDPGISSNFVTRLGWENKITLDLSWISELSRYETKLKLPAKFQTNVVYGVETGLNLKF